MGPDSMLRRHLTGSFCVSVLLGFTSALRGPSEVHGFIGSSVPVVCHYDKSYQTYVKYWCKGESWRSCTEVVRTKGSEAEVKADRTSIKDNHTCSCFTVTLENLREEDAGVYWCAIEKSLSDLNTQVTVVPGCFSESLTCTSTVRAPLGGSLSILCNYTEYPAKDKYCCRGEDWDSSCKKIITTKPSLVEKQGRISVNDSRSLHTFSVIIENLTLEDEGKYWCAIDIPLRYDFYYPVTVEIFREPLPPTTIAVTTGYFPTVPTLNKRLTENTKRSPFNIRLYLPIVLLALLVVLLVGGLLMVWRLKKQNAAKGGYEHTLQSMVPSRAEGNVSNAAVAANVRPNYKTPSPNSDQDLKSTLHVEYTSVKRTPASSTQPQVPSTNAEDVSYTTIKFPAQDEQAIYANLK